MQVSQQEGATTRSKSRGELRTTPTTTRTEVGTDTTRSRMSVKRARITDPTIATEAISEEGSSQLVVIPARLEKAVGRNGTNASNVSPPEIDGPVPDVTATTNSLANPPHGTGMIMTGLATQLAELATLLSRTLASGVCQSTIVPVTSGAPPVSQAIRLPTETAEVSQSVMTAERGEKRQRLDMAPLEQRTTEEPEIISLADQESVASGRDSRSVEMDWPRRQMRPLASMARPRPGKGPYGASGQAAQLARLLKAPPQFDGLAIHLEDWMTAFESYAGGIRMPEYMRVPSACSYLLPATLRQLGLAVVATRPATFTELKRFLLAYYFGADQSERYVTEALDATQKPSESLEAYAARLKELIRLANQTAECVPLALEIQLFIKGLRDVHTKRGMTFLRADDLDRMKRGKQPRLATYEQCVVVARKHEASDPIREGTVNAAAVASTSGTMPVCAVATTSKTKEQLVAEAHEVLRVHGTEPTP